LGTTFSEEAVLRFPEGRYMVAQISANYCIGKMENKTDENSTLKETAVSLISNCPCGTT
jgi:hypothetical protein